MKVRPGCVSGTQNNFKILNRIYNITFVNFMLANNLVLWNIYFLDIFVKKYDDMKFSLITI